MDTQYENEPMSAKQRKAIDRVASELLTQKPETRIEASRIIENAGFASYIGGCHVAIHRKGDDGRIVGPRLAIVTHSAPDWN